MSQEKSDANRGSADQNNAKDAMKLLGEKLVDPRRAVGVVQSGDRVFVGSACATPRILLGALEDTSVHDVQIYHFLTDGAMPEKNGQRTSRFQHRTFFVSFGDREAVRQGGADYIPISLAQVSNLLASGQMTPDVAFVQTSAPDEHGYVSLGVSVDITASFVKQAKRVVAEINPHMPRTLGDSFVHISRFDYAVTADTPVIEFLHDPVDNVSEQIARYAARIIDDGSTLQVGLGQIPNEMLKHLKNRKDIGIHSDVITEPIIDLVKDGVVTGAEKTIHQGQIVASYCMGSKKLYDLVHENPLFAFYPIDYICDPLVLGRNHKLVSISQAFAIDLTGQICADQYKGEFYSGVSTQPDFLRSAAYSKGGKPIICLTSTAENGTESRIRPQLLQGEGVTIPRSDVHWVITEYGSAYLFNKSIRERALSLIEIAHPDFRQELLEEGKKLGYIRPDQQLRSKIAYPEAEERNVTLKNGETVRIRPSRASDVEAMQSLFYKMSPDDIYTRFFRKLSSLSVSNAQHLCNVDYEQEMAYVAELGDPSNKQLVGSSCYYVDPATNLAEVAYMIHPSWQRVGLGSALQKTMTSYAKNKGIRGFVAEILRINSKMIKLAMTSENVKVHTSGQAMEVTTFF